MERVVSFQSIRKVSPHLKEVQEAVTKGKRALSLETLEKVSIPFQIETRFPFWDIRLVQFCLALPAEQKIRWSGTRFILRQAMARILPPIVRRP